MLESQRSMGKGGIQPLIYTVVVVYLFGAVFVEYGTPFTNLTMRSLQITSSCCSVGFVFGRSLSVSFIIDRLATHVSAGEAHATHVQRTSSPMTGSGSVLEREEPSAPWVHGTAEFGARTFCHSYSHDSEAIHHRQAHRRRRSQIAVSGAIIQFETHVYPGAIVAPRA